MIIHLSQYSAHDIATASDMSQYNAVAVQCANLYNITIRTFSEPRIEILLYRGED